MRQWRRYVPLTPYAYCEEPGCPFFDSGYEAHGSPAEVARLVAAQASDHSRLTGHGARAFIGHEVIYRAAPAPGTCARHPAEDAPDGVLGCCAETAVTS